MALQQERAWGNFSRWVQNEVSHKSWIALERCPALLAQILKAYGRKLFAEGASLHVFRMTLTAAQRKYELVRPFMSPAWQVVTR